MRALILTLAIVSTGCASGWEPPVFDGCPWSDDEGVVMVDLVGEAFGHRFGDAPDFRGLVVECQPGREITFTGWTGEVKEHAGVMLNPGHVIVASGGAERAVDTVLAHELVHVALHQTEGRADVDHAHGEGPWTRDHDAFIEDVNAHHELQ